MSTRKFLPWKTGEKKVAEYHSYVSKSNILCFNNRRESAAKKGYLKNMTLYRNFFVLRESEFFLSLKATTALIKLRKNAKKHWKVLVLCGFSGTKINRFLTNQNAGKSSLFPLGLLACSDRVTETIYALNLSAWQRY